MRTMHFLDSSDMKGRSQKCNYVLIIFTIRMKKKTYFFITLSHHLGVHYWYNMTEDMSCERIFPIFLLFNGGRLNAFGFAFATNITDSEKRFEHPPQNAYGVCNPNLPKPTNQLNFSCLASCILFIVVETLQLCK